jgi:hypothetical protein
VGNLEGVAVELARMMDNLGIEGEGDVPEVVLRRVIAIENRCGAIHAEDLARSASPEVRGFFAALARQDAIHKELLEQALDS